jgi:hypothetical protein
VRRLAVFLCLCLATAPAFADVYTLADGDRVTGKSVGVEGGIYKVQTAYGRLAIPRGRILKILHDDGREEILDSAAAAGAAATPAEAEGPELVLVVSGTGFWQAWSTKDPAFDPTLSFEVSLDEVRIATYADARADPEIPGALMNAFSFDAESVTPAAAEGVGAGMPEIRPGRSTLRITLPTDRAGERKLRVAYLGADADGNKRELASNSIYVEIKAEAPTFVRVKQDTGRMDFGGFPKKKMKNLETFRFEMGME